MRLSIAVLLSLGLGGCLAEVAAVDISSPAATEAPAPVLHWRATPINVHTDPGSGGVVDQTTRGVLAELAVGWRARRGLHLRLRAVVRARSHCPTGHSAERGAREREIEDGAFPVYLDFDQQVYLDNLVQELVDLGLARERIETVVSDRFRVGTPTEYARLHVFVDFGLPAEAPADR